MANDNLRRLYNTLLREGYTPPAFEQFAKDMEDEENLRRVHTTLQSEGYTPPKFETFKTDMGFGVQTAQPAAQPQQSATQTTTTPQSATPVQQTGWRPSPVQMAAFNDQVQRGQAALQKQVDDTRRVTERFTPQGREKARVAEFTAKLVGTPTSASLLPDFRGGLDDPNSPIPAGVKSVNGQPMTEWQMPDGSLTTNMAAASVAENEARTKRLAHAFDNRMRSFGLNPTNQADRQRQTLIDGIHSGIDFDPAEREEVFGVMRQYELDPNNMEHVAWVVKGDERKIIEHRLALAEDKLKGLMGQRAANLDAASEYNEEEGFWDNFVRIVGGAANRANQNMHPTPKPIQEKTQLDKDIEAAQAEVVRLSSDLRHYDQNTEASQRGFLGKTMQGLWDGITDPNSWTMGVLEASANKTIRDVADGGNSSDYARSLILSASTSQEMMADAPDPGAWYGGGRFVGEMLGDPITYASAGLGNFARKGATQAVVRRGAKRVEGEIGERLMQNSLKARLAGAAIGTGVNLGTFEGLRDMKQQWIDGGYVDDGYTDEQGVYHPGEFHEGISLWHSTKAAGRGFGLGTAMGLFGAGFGNVADKAVKGTHNVWGKAAIRGVQYPTSAVIEGTIFAAPEIYEFQTMDDAQFDYLYADKFGYADETDPAKRDKARDEARNSVSIDAWTQSQAQIFGMKLAGKPTDKVKHAILHPKQTAAGIGHVAETINEMRNGRRGFKEVLAERLDRSPLDVTFTDEEREELRKAGYGELADLFVKDSDKQSVREIDSKPEDGALEEHTERVEPEELTVKHPEFDGYSEMEKLMSDRTVSEAARAKAYFILTGKMLPTSTITGWTTEQDGEYTIVKSLSADGSVVTSRRFKSEKGARAEEAKIKRQVELNTIDMGEQFAQQEALRTFGRETYASVGLKYHLIKEGVENIFEKYLRGEELSETELKIANDVVEAVSERAKKSSLDPVAIRERIKKETGLDIDKVIRKPETERTDEESAALNLYIEHLYTEGARMRRANDLWREQTEEARQEYVNDRKRDNGLLSEPKPRKRHEQPQKKPHAKSVKHLRVYPSGTWTPRRTHVREAQGDTKA